MLVLYLTYIDSEEDKEKFERLYDTYKKQMAIVAMAIVHNEVDVEDIVHDVFLNVATRHIDTINRITDETDLRNYMLKATKNTALNWIKKGKRLVYTTNERNVEPIVFGLSDDTFIEFLCHQIEYARVLDAIKKLEPKYRDVLYQHFVMEIPVPQLAKSKNQSLAATKKQLVRGKKKLLVLLEGEKENGND
ncbi:MAG: sigma-70 family RNA polymerase sigma factor [Agathobacter sp.]|nr:sigma-70 family RNA polymerase sigma factor [Agathobacter sp.]MBQ2902688.1 sigma-70 family RNA polymerase sigma factor [Agathobacter sp.]